ncbi:MAG TPA: hypothetical protein ENG69_03725 [Candidatus Korarchaeota archaeon]|nr:hypothetical protein [Candidatus Korarchaeota archaeon]
MRKPDAATLVGWASQIVPAAILGVAARVAADALHFPGYFDSLGAMWVAQKGLAQGLLGGVLTGLLLTAYYKAYMAAFWVPGLAALLYGFMRRRGRPILGALLAALAYVLGWAAVYCLATGTWKKIPLYLHTKGALILALDILICSGVGEGLSPLLARLDDRRVVAGVMLAALATTGLAYIQVEQNEWGIAGSFPEREGWEKFHSKMDLVWIWMGEKGINNYYYPETRFTRGDPGYQVWVGLYWIQGWHDVADVSLDSAFAVWDQNFWNGIHGVPGPYTYVIDVHNITEINFKGYRAYLMYGGMLTLSDVEPYEEVWLEGFFITFYNGDLDRTAIIYACATKDNLPAMIDELWALINSWELGLQS